MKDTQLVVDLIDHYLDFLSAEKNQFLIPEEPDNLVFLPENCIVDVLNGIKNKGYGNLDLLEVIRDEEIVARIKELIEKVKSEEESELKIAFAFPVIKIKDKKAYCALTKIKLETSEEKLIATSREFNRNLIEKVKEQSKSDNKDSISIPKEKDDSKRDFEFYLKMMEILAGLSHLHLITLPELLSEGLIVLSMLNSVKEIRAKLVSDKLQENILQDENQRKNLDGLEEDKIGIIYLYQDERFTKKIADDLSKLKQKLDEETKNKISQLWNFESERQANKSEIKNIAILDYELTKSQREAYESMINKRFSLIEGPPGTGKTHLIATFAADMILEGKKTVITSTNNRAVDNVYKKLKEFDCKIERHLKTGKILHGYVRLGSSNYIKDFVEYLFDFVNEVKQIPPWSIEESFNLLAEEVEILKKFIEKYLLLQNFSTTEFELFFTDQQSMKNFVQEHLLTLNFLLDRLNQWNANLFPFSLFFGKKYKESLAEFCHERGLVLPALKDRKYLTCREIYNREKHTISLLPRVCELNCIREEFEDLAEKLQRIVNENTDSMEKLFEKVRKLYFIRKRELNYWELAKNKQWLNDIEKKKNSIEEGKFWGSEDIIFKFAPVVITTALTSTNVCKQEVDLIDYVIVDEAAQTLFCYVFPLFIRGKIFIAIGDDNQLGPVITNRDYIQIPQDMKPYLTYDKTAYYVIKEITKEKYIGLKEHFRCARTIIEFCDALINYGLRVETKEDRLAIKNSKISMLFEKNLTFIDVKGISKGNRSKYNEKEIRVISEIISDLQMEIDLKQVGVIAPYRLQVEKLRNSLRNLRDLTIGTVHTFQGEERDVIILSCVCAKTEEFQRSRLLKDKKLMNVAVSRARKHLIVVGNKDAIENIADDDFPIKALLKHISVNGTIVLR
ncbi:AAA domain-containing protein [Thermodesulfovibrio sp. 3907-1M]|uniref:AAA domain-containing protein n=1 Tax=Thermodesulfovibrio autotrophicus TaxID=3118333 RepID=A0AAU8GX82_9BACT